MSFPERKNCSLGNRLIMSSIIVAAIMVALIIIITLVLVIINNKDKRKSTLELFHRFKSITKATDLTYSSQEILDNLAIGIDGVQRKILAINRNEIGLYDPIIVDLNQVKSCSKRKFYRSINTGTSRKKRIEQQIDKIVLEFTLRNGQQLEIPFFEMLRDHIPKMRELEQKAADWEVLISNFMNAEVKRIA